LLGLLLDLFTIFTTLSIILFVLSFHISSRYFVLFIWLYRVLIF
jgi:hypothetical protein